MSRLPDRPSGGGGGESASLSEKYRAGPTPTLPERPSAGSWGRNPEIAANDAESRFAQNSSRAGPRDGREREERRRSRSRTPSRDGAGWRRSSRSLSPPRGYRGDPRNFNPNYRGRPQREAYRREPPRRSRSRSPERRRSRSRSPDRRRPRSPLRRPYDALPSPGPSRRRRSVSRDVRTRSPSSRREDSYERGEIRPPPRQRSPPPVARPRSPDPRDRYARESTSRNRSPPPHTLPRSRQLSPSPPPRSTRDQPSPPRQDSYRRDRSQPVRSPELTRTGYAVESTIPSGPRSRYAVAAPTPSSSSSAWRAPRGPHDTSFQTSERQQPQFARRQSPIESRVDAGSIIPTGPKGWSAGRTPAAPQSTGSYKQGPMSIPPNITTTATISTTSTTTVVGGQHGQAMALAKQQQAILQKAIVVKEAEMRGADDDPYVRTSHSPPPSNDNGNAMSVDVAALPTGPRRVAGFAQMGEEAKQRAAVGAARAAAVAAKLEQAALLRWLPKGKYNPPVVVGIDTESDIARQRSHRINNLLPEHLRQAKTSRSVLADLANWLVEAEAAKERVKSSLESA